MSERTIFDIEKANDELFKGYGESACVPTNFLIAYKGGGYSGCFWEWNYGVVLNKLYIDLLSSGYKAIKTGQQLEEYLLEAQSNYETNYYIYCLEKPESMAEFAKEHNYGHVLQVIEAIQEQLKFDGSIGKEAGNIIDNLYIPFQCEKCGEEVDLYCEECYRETVDGVICSDCYYTGHCEECGEYVGERDVAYHEFEGTTMCTSCWKNHEFDEDSDAEEHCCQDEEGCTAHGTFLYHCKETGKTYCYEHYEEHRCNECHHLMATKSMLSSNGLCSDCNNMKLMEA